MNKKIIQKLQQTLKIPYDRKELIQLIKEYSGEEYENKQDLWELAGDTDSQLIKKLQV